MPKMVFRSPITRWILAGIGAAAGVIFTFGDGYKWRSTSSLRWLAQAPIPLQAWGVAFIVYGVLLLSVRTRPIGFALGGVLFCVFSASLLATLGDPAPKNVITLAAVMQAAVVNIYFIGIAMTMKDLPAGRK